MRFRFVPTFCTAVLTATAVIAAGAADQNGRAPFWPDVAESAVLKEWYSDLPWHQKLGTYAGNQIDEALMLPYDALPDADKKFSDDRHMTREDCMIELGVSNILGMRRVDTLYTLPMKGDPAECRDPSLPCIEVKLKMSNFHFKSVGDLIARVPRVFGNDQGSGGVYDKYTITDGSTYAPQLPWFMSHYCDAMFKALPNHDVNDVQDVQDPVCYGDYFSPFNNGFNAWGDNGRFGWPRAVPWSPWPQADTNHCLEGVTECDIAMSSFALDPVPPALTKDTQFARYNTFLLQWFNYALAGFKSDASVPESRRHFPWSGNPVTWDDLQPQSVLNPFLGTFAISKQLAPPQNVSDCDTTLTGPSVENCTTTAMFRAAQSLYPRQCAPEDVDNGDAGRLRKCGVNYEMHHNGWLQQWPAGWEQDLVAANISPSNQYGRTSFLFAGVPGMQLPVSFYKDAKSPSGLSVYEQVYNTSIFSLYIPIANEADTKRAFPGRQYKDTEFYHTLLMSNHMEADPDVFADGIRGKALWHNEYRMQGMYNAFLTGTSQRFPAMTFNAAFADAEAKAPYHNNTCDGCHVRNGSGVPINTGGTLDAKLQEFMSKEKYDPAKTKDYTFTGQIRPMKLVFFDLGRSPNRTSASLYSTPLAFTPLTLLQPPRAAQPASLYYSNPIMNYYGDSFHVTTPGNSYQWSYGAAGAGSLVVSTERRSPEFGTIYTPWQVNLENFTTPADCKLVLFAPARAGRAWPRSCDDVSGEKIAKAIASQQVGYMLLNGKRLGNSSAIEAMPNDAIKGFRDSQRALLGEAIAGEIAWTVGSRGGVDGTVHRHCRTNSAVDCFIGRFGWIGDRASLEDQVANAAFVEMNMTSSEGYRKLYPDGKSTTPIRYLVPNCGPANKACVESTRNSDLSERDIERMADYARWVGNPTRSEFQVTLKEVVEGERVFRNLKCDTCHVIKRIDITPEETMLAAAYRERLQTRVVTAKSGKAIRPFLSYLGTDLLMHDMGYLSQVGIAPAGARLRDPDTGVVNPVYRNFVQKIRTPALKGMRFNRFVTDSHRNTKQDGDPACDFLLHDGRACDALEAAFLHDGPAIRKLGVIDALNGLAPRDVTNLRAFLYSL